MSIPHNYPNRVLSEVREVESRLDLARLSLEQLQGDIDTQDKSDDKRLTYIRMLIEARHDLAREYCALAVVKAKYGVIGFSWYKSNETDKD